MAGISAATGQLLRELLSESLTPESMTALGDALVEAGQALRHCGRTQQDSR